MKKKKNKLLKWKKPGKKLGFDSNLKKVLNKY